MSDSPAPPDNRTDRLGTERIGKLLLEFSIPAIVSMVFNTLYNVVDTIFLGQAPTQRPQPLQSASLKVTFAMIEFPFLVQM